MLGMWIIGSRMGSLYAKNNNNNNNNKPNHKNSHNLYIFLLNFIRNSTKNNNNYNSAFKSNKKILFLFLRFFLKKNNIKFSKRYFLQNFILLIRRGGAVAAVAIADLSCWRATQHINEEK